MSFLKTWGKRKERAEEEVQSRVEIPSAFERLPSTDHVVVVPSLTEIVGIPVLSVSSAEVSSDREIVAEGLNERLFSKRFRSLG